jgi:hypothetical protein
MTTYKRFISEYFMIMYSSGRISPVLFTIMEPSGASLKQKSYAGGFICPG